MKVNKTPRLTGNINIDRELSEHAALINLMTDGRISGTNNANTAPPTGDAYAQGDFVRNRTPSELGSSGSKYVIFGWLCLADGTPGTLVQCRFLTGN